MRIFFYYLRMQKATGFFELVENELVFDNDSTNKIKLNTWNKDRRFVVSRVLKPEKERAQLSLLEGSDCEYFFFVTNIENV